MAADRETPDDAWASRVSAGIAGGSREALAALYERRFELLYRTACDRTGRDEAFALDCVQDAMIRIANSLPHIDREASLDAWLRRVVLTSALDRLRGERSRARRENTIASIRDEASQARTTTDSVIDTRLRAIAAEVAALSADDRSLLALRFRRGLTLAQIAEHSGLAPKAIDSRIRRVLARLRLRLRGATSSKESP